MLAMFIYLIITIYQLKMTKLLRNTSNNETLNATAVIIGHSHLRTISCMGSMLLMQVVFTKGICSICNQLACYHNMSISISEI